MCRRVPSSGTACAARADSGPRRSAVDRAPMRRLLAALPFLVVVACESTTQGPATAGGGDGPDAGAEANAPETKGVEVLGVIDLPRTANTQSLSATYYDAPTRTLHALQDKVATVVPIAIAEDYASASVGQPLALTGRPVDAWDGEGIARIGDEIYAVTQETVPIVERFAPSGAFIARVDVPAYFSEQASGNKGLESLSASPDGAFLFTANEAALTSDGAKATKSAGTTVRIFRRELAGGAEIEKRYTTEPLGEGGTTGDMGVSEIAALSEHELLVLERGFQPDFGSTVRIYRVDLDEDADVLTKTLVVDVATLPSDGISHPGTQPNPILDNYEALAIGPTLDDGRVTLFVTSDDNGSAEQVARILVLAIPRK
jgi:hypothetical protein